jgi:hypothetical protein
MSNKLDKLREINSLLHKKIRNIEIAMFIEDYDMFDKESKQSHKKTKQTQK